MKKASSFDPSEAIDTVHKVLTFCGKRHPAGHPFDDGTTVLPEGDVETIHNQLHSLRAYLAGRMDAAPQDAVQDHGKCGCCGVDMAFHVYLDEQVNRHLMLKSVAEEKQRRHHRKRCVVVQCGPEKSAAPLGREAVAALKQEAENAPDVPGIADWGRKAVLSLIASHEELRESIHSPYGVCEHCDVPMEREHALDRMVDQDVLTEVSAAEIKRRHHRRGCPYSGRYPLPYWARPEPFFHVRNRLERTVPHASDGMMTIGPFEPGSTVEIKVRR